MQSKLRGQDGHLFARYAKLHVADIAAAQTPEVRMRRGYPFVNGRCRAGDIDFEQMAGFVQPSKCAVDCCKADRRLTGAHAQINVLSRQMLTRVGITNGLQNRQMVARYSLSGLVQTYVA